MQLRRVLIAWELGGNLGHLARLLPIARHLRLHGTDIAVAARNPSRVLQVLACEGATVWQAPAGGSAPPTRAARNHPDVLLLDGFADRAGVMRRVAGWKRLFVEFQPDVVLADFSPMAIFAARACGVPVLPIGHGFDIPPPLDATPSFQPWAAQGDLEAKANAELEDALRVLVPMLGARTPATLAALYPPRKSALCIFPELDHFERPEGQNCFVGPLWGDLSDQAPPAWPKVAGKRVLCYLQPDQLLLVSLADALGAWSCSVILLSPGLSAAGASLLRARGMQVATEPVAVAALVEQADAVITQGGMGFVAMAFQAGLPLLLLPAVAEQLILARALVKRTLCAATVHGADMRVLQKKIEALLRPDPARAEALGRYQANHRAYMPGIAVQKTVQLLEAHRMDESHDH